MTDPNDGSTLTEASAAVQSALATLQRLGQSDKVEAIVNDVAAQASYADLDADTDHNDDWRRRAYAQRYTSVLSTLARKLTAAAGAAGTQDQDDAARVFGFKGLPGDVAVLTITLRDAADRVAQENDSVQLQRLLATAVRNGDETFAHAVAEKAITNGDADTANAFSAAYPHLSDAVERLWTAEHRKMSTLDVKVGWHIAALKPAFISNLQDYEIARAAAGDTAVGQWNVGR
jgi:hypothetical protein